MRVESITELIYTKDKLQETSEKLSEAWGVLRKLSDYSELSDKILEAIEQVDNDCLDVSIAIKTRLKIEKITDK